MSCAVRSLTAEWITSTSLLAAAARGVRADRPGNAELLVRILRFTTCCFVVSTIRQGGELCMSDVIPQTGLYPTLLYRVRKRPGCCFNRCCS